MSESHSKQSFSFFHHCQPGPLFLALAARILFPCSLKRRAFMRHKIWQVPRGAKIEIEILKQHHVGTLKRGSFSWEYSGCIIIFLVVLLAERKPPHCFIQRRDAISCFLPVVFQPLAPSDRCSSSSASSSSSSFTCCCYLSSTHLQVSSSSSERFITFNYLNFILDLYLAYLIWASAGLLVTLNTRRLIDLRQRGTARLPSDAWSDLGGGHWCGEASGRNHSGAGLVSAALLNFGFWCPNHFASTLPELGEMPRGAWK